MEEGYSLKRKHKREHFSFQQPISLCKSRAHICLSNTIKMPNIFVVLGKYFQTLIILLGNESSIQVEYKYVPSFSTVVSYVDFLTYCTFSIWVSGP